MSERSEVYSLPWHALLKSLAEADTTNALSSIALIRARKTLRRSPCALTNSSGNWLDRARGSTACSAVGAS